MWRAHPTWSCALSFRNGQILLNDFFLSGWRLHSSASSFHREPGFCRTSNIVPSQVPILSYFPVLWLSGLAVAQLSVVPANLSPSLLGFQPLPWDPANLSSALLSPHPCQFWLISQTKRALIAAAGFPWSACQGECNREREGRVGGGGGGYRAFCPLLPNESLSWFTLARQ